MTMQAQIIFDHLKFPEERDYCKLKEPEVPELYRASSDVCDGGDHNMKKEEDRLKSFENWPISFIDPSKLAKEGFYYMKIDDRVKCEFCKVEIARWEEGDNPSIDHQRWAPNCPFLRKLNVGNIPLGASESTDSHADSDVCGPHLTVRPNAICESSEAHSSKKIQAVKPPKHVLYATHTARLRSFTSWPSSVKQRPAELVEAGFFYTGEGDRVICYHCGLGLKDWTETDTAWEQHARWFPHCSYVQLIKGMEYVNNIMSAVSIEVTKETTKKLEPKVPISTDIQPKKEPESNSAKPSSSKSAEQNYSSTIPDDKLCKICYIEEKNAVYIPCGHVFSCIKCALSVKDCPVCRQPYTDVMRVYFS